MSQNHKNWPDHTDVKMSKRPDCYEIYDIETVLMRIMKYSPHTGNNVLWSITHGFVATHCQRPKK